ncbi:hypothetical protein KC19_8G128300 [Ceratodon purpureus]|uniref:Uncharacterized protein n=1 Tax=Ceratodon purpureus TaxID=3225 RepID=A0A8T0GXZ2_CERPU|nr:hypothetical protein KC19_8G128300 [Ceratodon purpureus]
MAMVMMHRQHIGHGAATSSWTDCKLSLGWLGGRRAAEELKSATKCAPTMLRRRAIYAARKNQSGSRYQQTKRWKVDESVKKIGHAGIEKFRSSFEDKESASGEGLALRGDQAVGQVIAAQANFMRVFIERTGQEEQVEGSFYGDDVEGRRNGADAAASTSGVNAWEVNCGAKAGTELLCVVRAVLKKIKRRVLVGDRVLVSGIDWVDRRGMVEDVLDRRSEIAEPPVANVEHLLVLFAFDRPKLEPIALSRFLIEAESTGIPFTLILNKADLVPQQEVHDWKEKIAGWGYKPVICSVRSRSGVAPVVELLKGKTAVVVGPSGVGKSSLINALRDVSGIEMWREREAMERLVTVASVEDDGVIIPQVRNEHEEFEALQVSEVSSRSGKGRHTTRHVSLLRLPGDGGLLADTPGFSQPSLNLVTSGELGDLFPEVRERIVASPEGGCLFANCLHVGEPSCAVGTEWDRYPHYLGLLDEVRKREEVEKRVLGTKRESDVRYKITASGVKQAEPRLQPKRHRRESRKTVRQSLDEKLWEKMEEQAEVEDVVRES